MNDSSLATPDLLARLDDEDAGVAAAAARELASRNDPSVVPRLLEVLRATNNAVVRDAIALALSDMKEPQAFDALVDLLRDERTANSRGTLLYALAAFDCSRILPMLVGIVITGNYETSRQALSIVHGIETELQESEWNDCVVRLQGALDSASPERRPLILELLSLFEQPEP